METNINKETRKTYEAPVIEIVEIKVEQGFQMSGIIFTKPALKET